jgi:hypothetical protein
MSPIELTLPLPPNIGNARMHWRTKLNAKKRWNRAASFLWHIGKLPDSFAAPNKVRITAHLVVGGKMDIDNIFARLKWPIDFLKDFDYIVNDDPEHLEWGAMPTQEVSRKKAYTVTFTITPIPEES